MPVSALEGFKSCYRNRGNPRSTPSGFTYLRAGRRYGIIALSMGGIFLGVMLGSIAFFGLTGKEKRVPSTIVVEKIAPLEMVEVLVPTKPIAEGTALYPSLFMKVQRPKIGIPPGALESFDQIKGGYAKAALLPNYPIEQSLISQDSKTNAVVSNIPLGFRAVTINVNATTGVEGWARAGAHVDVHWISDVLGERTATLLVRNARVLSAERQVSAEAGAGAPVPTTVTLLASEMDAQKISLASSAGSLVLHLRGVADNGKVNSSVSTLSFKDLLGKRDSEGAEEFQGVARMVAADGSVREWAISNGRLMRKRQ